MTSQNGICRMCLPLFHLTLTRFTFGKKFENCFISCRQHQTGTAGFNQNFKLLKYKFQLILLWRTYGRSPITWRITSSIYLVDKYNNSISNKRNISIITPIHTRENAASCSISLLCSRLCFELGPKEEDLVELYEEDMYNGVVRLVFLHHRLSLVSISAQKPHLLYSRPGDGRFSGIKIKLGMVLHTEEIEGDHVHPCKLKPLDKLPELLGKIWNLWSVVTRGNWTKTRHWVFKFLIELVWRRILTL